MTEALPRAKRFAVVLAPDRHCLEGIRLPKVRILPPDQAALPNHHLLVVPSCDQIGLLDRLHALPPETWTNPRSGVTTLVLDASLEGRPHDPDWALAVDGFLQGVGVPSSRVVYVTQNRGYAADDESFRRAAGLGPGMKVVVFDYWVRAVARQHELDGEAAFEERLAAYRARPRRRRWRFLSLNWTLRPAKTLFLLRLLEDGLFERGAISVHPIRRRMKKMEASHLSLPAFADLNARLASYLPRLREVAGATFSTDKADPKLGPVLDDPLAEYGESWFSVVTETEMGDAPCRITEKPLKALLNFHPLIMLGNPGALELLRGYGFATFGGLVDERYDQELDPRRRFEMVYAEVRRLCALDEAELDRLEQALDEVIVFNARHGLTRLPKLFRDRYDPDLVADIVAAGRGQSCMPG